MNILIKFPTRERTTKFFSIFTTYLSYLSSNKNIAFLLTLDSDDPTMKNQEVINKIDLLSNIYKVPIYYEYGISTGKIHAINRDLETFKEFDWDILLLASDDMLPVKYGYDNVIRTGMKITFPDTDGILWYYDGFRPDLNTFPILGKKYYERFNYIYNPVYESMFADDEFMRVAQMLGKQYKSNTILFQHIHPVWTGQGYDELYKRNDALFNRDKEVFERRLLEDFGMVR